MNTTRRRFLKRGTMFGLAAAIPFQLAGKGAAQWVSQEDPLLQAGAADPYEAVSGLKKSSFVAAVGTTFRFQDARTKALYDLKLARVVDRTWVFNGRGELFAAVFQSSKRAVLRQNTYLIEHPAIGKFALLVVPMGSDSRGTYYEALVNRRF